MVPSNSRHSRITLRSLLFYIWLATFMAIALWFAACTYRVTYAITYRLLDAESSDQSQRVLESLQSIERILQTSAWQAGAAYQDFDLNRLVNSLRVNHLQDITPIKSIAWSGIDKRIIGIADFKDCDGYNIDELLQSSAATRGKLQISDITPCNHKEFLAAFAVSNKAGTYLGSVILSLDLETLYVQSINEGADLRYITINKEGLKGLKSLHSFGLDNDTAKKITAHLKRSADKEFTWIEPISNLLFQRPPVVAKAIEGYPIYVIAAAQHFITADLITGLSVVLWDFFFISAIMLWVLAIIYKFVVVPISSFAKSSGGMAGGAIATPRTYTIVEYQIIARLIGESMVQNESAEAERNKRNFLTSQLKAETEAQAGLLRNVQHEMRTPLHHIITGSEMLLKRKNLDADLKEYLEMIAKAGEQMLKMSNEMIAAASIESGLMTLNEKHCEVHKLLEQVIARVHTNAMQREIVISTSVSPDLPQVYIDPVQFGDALFYLLENSVKFGKFAGAVHVAAKRTNSGLIIEITDDGVGMPPEQLSKVNTILAGTHSVLRKAQEGIGFGLAIAYTILEMHHAKLQLESTGSEGLVARITIPNIRIKSQE